MDQIVLKPPLILQITLLITILLPTVLCQNSDRCETQETCSECIQELGCVWCISPNAGQSSNANLIHCRSKTPVDTNWCRQSSIIDPTSKFTILMDKGQSQITPRRVQIKLRKGEKYDIKFQYTQSRDYPTDLYYVMDLSSSMADHKDKLAELGEELEKAMYKLTKNFRLGFGSFVDKVELPFTSTIPEKLENPCDVNTKMICDPPYSFKNHLSLTSSAAEFARKVRESKLSGNIDSPEGGLDAVMQAIVCKDEIGWRSQARHLLVYSTDAYFHVAGDGKLAGIVEPNDGKCHMSNNTYTDYLKYDYPSVSHINYVAKQNNINMIFAIVKNTFSRSYVDLSGQIENSNIGFLDAKSKNVIDLVVDNYNKIVDAVSITNNATKDIINVKISSNCRNKTENGCTDVHVGETVNFVATIQPVYCPPNGQYKQIVEIKPQALEESVIVEVEVICDCECNTRDSFVENATQCTQGNGDLECGICSCKGGWFGKDCQCDSSTSQTEDETNCILNGQVCSGLGSCKCGICQCNPRPNPREVISGKYCQCNNYSCLKGNNGELCSGKGTCKCGECECFADYKGEACDCHDTNATCVAPGAGQLICSGHGSCNCGQCDCFTDGQEWTGKYCSECKSCPAQRCDELSPCVQCQAYKSGIYNEDDCKTNCTDFQTYVVEKFDDNSANGDEQTNKDVKRCRILDNDGCTIIFEYSDGEKEGLNVTALKKKICSIPLTPEEILRRNLAWILGVIGTILLAGLLILIIWKVCTTIHDKREYARFDKERKNAKWSNNQNPMYRDPNTTITNPVYNRFSINRLSGNRNSASMKSN